MEFDYCVDNAEITNFDYAKKLFSENGYELPKIVFWNVDSRRRQQPVRQNEQGVILVSGTSPRIFEMLTNGKITPEEYMLSVLNSERYKNITA